jgi:peptidoglycan/LPS O-acetylase OafA/YrhL
MTMSRFSLLHTIMAIRGSGSTPVGPSRSLEEVMNAESRHTNGFDYLRLGLALTILVVHGLETYDPIYSTLVTITWFGPIHRAILGCFFALSGFLVTGSLLRNNVPRFIALRIMRIVPALAVDIVLSALIIGICFTKLNLADYFHSPLFASYFLNIIGIVQFVLPGVFEGRVINSQLWTIPIEFECYTSIVALALVGFIANRKFLLATLFMASLTLTYIAVANNLVNLGPCIPAWAMVLCFLFGVALFLYKEHVSHSRWMFIVSIALNYVLLLFPNFVFLTPIPLAYMTIYIGLLRLPKLRFGDLSYGIFLFHAPVERTIFEISGRQMSAALLLVSSVVVTGLLAALSWNFVEKPLLGNKDKLLKIVDKIYDPVRLRFAMGKTYFSKRLLLSPRS